MTTLTEAVLLSVCWKGYHWGGFSFSLSTNDLLLALLFGSLHHKLRPLGLLLCYEARRSGWVMGRARDRQQPSLSPTNLLWLHSSSVLTAKTQVCLRMEQTIATFAKDMPFRPPEAQHEQMEDIYVQAACLCTKQLTIETSSRMMKKSLALSVSCCLTSMLTCATTNITGRLWQLTTGRELCMHLSSLGNELGSIELGNHWLQNLEKHCTTHTKM